MTKLYIEVAYSQKGVGMLCGVQVCQGTTVEGILSTLSIPIDDHSVGVNGVAVPLSTEVASGDRVELYPPLLVDPIEKRKRLVANRKKQGIQK